MGIRLFSVALLLVAGCALTEPTYIYVDSIASPGSEELKSYYLFSGRRGLSEKDAHYRRFSRITHDILQSRGYTRAEGPDRSEVVIALTYGVDRKRVQNHIERTSFVELAAFEWDAISKSDERNAIWRTRIYKDGSSGGLSHVIPQLLEAGGPYIGTSTGDLIEVVLD